MFIFLIISSILTNIIGIIVFPFKLTNLKMNINNDDTNIVDNFLSEINKNKIYSTIKIGNPSKNLELILSSNIFYYAIIQNFCPIGSDSSYNPYESQDYYNITKNDISYGLINQGHIAIDKCFFYNDLDLKNILEVSNFSYFLGDYIFKDDEKDSIEPNKFCGYFGIIDRYYLLSYPENFIRYLKKEKIIDTYSWSIFFFNKDYAYNINEEIQNKYDGLYIVGINENDIYNIFKTTDIYVTHESKNKNTLGIVIKFNKIYYNNTNNNSAILCSNDAELGIDYNYIYSDKIYFESIKETFFKKYFENKICSEKNSSGVFSNHIIICEKAIKKDLHTFPDLNFFSFELSYTFKLDYNDLFIEINNKIYFMVIQRGIFDSLWELGKIFMKKYPFIFDQDKSSIYFIHLNKKEKNDSKSFWDKNKNSILYILLSIGILIGIIVGIFVGKKLWKKRKSRANELDEDVDYINKEEKFTNIID